MNEIEVNNFKLNQFLTLPMYLDKNYILSYPDIAITADLKERLIKWKYRAVFCDGEFIADENSIPTTTTPNLDLENIKIDSEVFLKYKKAILFLMNTFASVKIKNVLDKNAILSFVRDFRNDVIENSKEFILAPHIETDDFSIPQSVRTAILTTLIANILKFPVHRQIDLIAAAFLHKIGMVKIPKKIYLSESKLNPEEIDLIKKYPLIGAKIVKDSEFTAEIVQAVMEHQEAYDGSGYPQKLKGENISLYARIINVASAYCAATSKRPYKEEEKTGHSSIIEILKGTSLKYDPKISKALIMTLSIYPLGTFVVTDDKNIGVVIKTNIDSPKNPEIQLLCDVNYKPLEKNPIVKTNYSGCKIVKTLTEDEVEKVKSVMKNWTDKMQKRLNS